MFRKSSLDGCFYHFLPIHSFFRHRLFSLLHLKLPLMTKIKSSHFGTLNHSHLVIFVLFCGLQKLNSNMKKQMNTVHCQDKVRKKVIYSLYLKEIKPTEVWNLHQCYQEQTLRTSALSSHRTHTQDGSTLDPLTYNTYIYVSNSTLLWKSPRSPKGKNEETQI